MNRPSGGDHRGAGDGPANEHPRRGRRALAKALLSLARRVEHLERIREYVERHVRFGNPVEDHRDLLVALQRAREQERDASGAEEAEFGLGGGRGT